jgi:hypothetical protein
MLIRLKNSHGNVLQTQAGNALYQSSSYSTRIVNIYLVTFTLVGIAVEILVHLR